MKKNCARGLTAALLLFGVWGLLRFAVTWPANYYSMNVNTSSRSTSAHVTAPKSKPNQPNYKRRAIVVFASMRTGSSFFGEYFNQHSEIYYLYDPLHGAGWGDAGASRRRDILWDLLRCNYSRISEIYTNMKNEKWKYCRNVVCFPDRSKFLWRNSHLCDTNKPICSNHLDPKELEKICRRSILTAVKEIAMGSLSELEPILADPRLDVKVIQLIRDPRPVVPSRLKMYRKDPDYSKASKSARDVCFHYSRNIPYTENCILGKAEKFPNFPSSTCNKEVQELWKDRFIRISHEFVSEQPLKSLELIYEFAGLNYDTNVAEWINENTAMKPPAGENEKDPTKEQYGRSRDSRAVISAWRTRETFENIDTIQKQCIQAMQHFGYVPVRNEQELRNLTLPLYDTTKHLILPPFSK